VDSSKEPAGNWESETCQIGLSHRPRATHAGKCRSTHEYLCLYWMRMPAMTT
jgi:hypothetical protein